jgi:hypothetical protein
MNNNNIPQTTNHKPGLQLYICVYMKRFSAALILLVFIGTKMLTLTSCANILPPTGGLRDSLPPRLVSASPRDSAVSVNPKTITLVFDEYITLQSAFSNLIISPIPSTTNPPLVDSKLRTITIKIKDTLETNTTYSFNFGNAITDVNESNIAKDFVYAFSTGPTIDYNTYSGKIMVAETGKPADSSSMIVILHRNLSDTAVAKDNPRYYTNLNGKGEFVFRNLPQGNFAVYAVSSRFTKRYTDSTDMFAFRTTPVTIGANTPHDTLYAYEEMKRRAPGSSSFNPSATRVIAGAVRNEDKRLRYTAPEMELSMQDILSPLKLNFNRKIFSFDSTKFGLYDTSYNLLKDYSITLDSTRTKVSLKYNWKENSYYRLLIAKDAVADSIGTTLTKIDTIRFSTKKETDYGSIRVRFVNLDLSKNPVLQIVQNEKLVDSVVLTSSDFQRKLFRPGTYDLRILYDANKNGKWDPGHFPGNKRQPETVFLVPRPLTIRSNWDNDLTVVL